MNPKIEEALAEYIAARLAKKKSKLLFDEVHKKYNLFGLELENAESVLSKATYSLLEILDEFDNDVVGDETLKVEV